MADAGIVTRVRRPGAAYAYTVAARFLPAMRGVSHRREKGVPRTRTEEKVVKKTERAGARFVSFGEMPDDRIKWQARLRSWRQSRFRLPLWGPKPGEAGCFAPAALLTTA